MRHILTPLDFSVSELDQIFDTAADIEANPKKYANACRGKKLATLFYEPSTRTRLSTETAMLNMGGSTMGFSDANSSSVSKGESIADTIRTVSCFADIAAIRHPKEGAAMVAKQAFNNMTIGLCGDLKFGRTVHSLIAAMSRYQGIRFIFISPNELRIPDYVTDMLDEKGIPYQENVRLDDVIGRLDILYMTRVQRERFFNEEDYVRLKDFYVLTKKTMRRAKNDMFVLHPLPRVNEISVEVDNDPRAAYFRQVQYGVYVRMALILTLLGIKVNDDGEVIEEGPGKLPL